MARLVEEPPSECLNGHPFRPRTYLVGWDNTREVPCRVYICRVCEEAIYRPR